MLATQSIYRLLEGDASLAAALEQSFVIIIIAYNKGGNYNFKRLVTTSHTAYRTKSPSCEDSSPYPATLTLPCSPLADDDDDRTMD